MKYVNSFFTALFAMIVVAFQPLFTFNAMLGQRGDIDLFETRTMLRALEQMKAAKTFLLDTFFKTMETSTTANVDIDIIKGKRKLAPFVSPKMQGKVMDRLGFATRSYKPPYVKPKMVTTAQDFLNRNAGDHIYAGADTAASRAAKQVGKDLRYLEEIITRREEWMASQLLQTGKVAIVGDGVDDEIDFGMDASHLITLTGNDLWSDQTNSTPLEDLRAWRRIILKDSGLNTTDAIMGSDALDAFLDHPDVQNKLDTRRIDLGQIDPRQTPAGAIYYGRIKDVALDLWVYDEWYYDEDTSTEKPMIDTKKVVLGSTQARTARHYGAIQDLEATASVPRFPKSWTEQDPSVRFIMVQSAPLVSLHQVDGFLCAAVLS